MNAPGGRIERAMAVHTRREREIMNVLYRRRRATAREIQADLSKRPSYATVRTQLRVLERKSQVRRQLEGGRYVYSPTMPRSAIQKAVLKHLVQTFFDGSVEGTIRALLQLATRGRWDVANSSA